MAAQHALRTSSIANGSDLFNYNDVLRDPKASGKKKIEPFYFDPRRFASALDTGFSVDTQGMETPAHPAVELLALIGLQRFHPMHLPFLIGISNTELGLSLLMLPLRQR